MENLGHLIFFLTLSIIDCNGQKGVPSASIKDQNNGPAFQDYDNVNIFRRSLLSAVSISVAPDLMGLIKLQIKTGVHLINVELSQLLTLSTGNILL